MTHTELAAQARHLAYLIEVYQQKLDPAHLNMAATCLRELAALEPTERLAGGGEPKPVGVLHEEALGRGVVFWFAKPPDGSNLYTTPPPQAERVPPLPKSYSGGLLLADDEGTTVRLNFTNNAEAERWFESVTDEYERAHGITPKEGT